MLPSAYANSICRSTLPLPLPLSSRCRVLVANYQQLPSNKFPTSQRAPFSTRHAGQAQIKVKINPKARNSDVHDERPTTTNGRAFALKKPADLHASNTARRRLDASGDSTSSSHGVVAQSTSSEFASNANPSTKYDFSDPINPPTSIFPPPLSVPEREPDQGTFKYYLTVGKTYWTFYKTGLKNVWNNGKQAQLFKQRKGDLTRAELQFVLRARHDSRRLPILGILLLVMGEYLPLVVVFLTPVIPYACRIPKQIRKTREKAEERRAKSFRGEFGRDGAVPTPMKADGTGPVQRFEDLNAVQVMHIARSLNIFHRFLDSLVSVVPVWPSNKSVANRINKIRDDDERIWNHGGMERLRGKEEVEAAAEARGIDVLNRDTEELRRLLLRWQQRSTKDNGAVYQMLLSRPSVW